MGQGPLISESKPAARLSDSLCARDRHPHGPGRGTASMRVRGPVRSAHRARSGAAGRAERLIKSAEHLCKLLILPDPPSSISTFFLLTAKHLCRFAAASDCCAALILCRCGRKAMQPTSCGAPPVRKKAAMPVAGNDGGNYENTVAKRAAALYEARTQRSAVPDRSRAAEPARGLD